VQSTGQGHATTFNPMLAERLGIKLDQIEHRHGDSAMEIAGYASVGSRSAMTVSHAMIKTVEALLTKGKTIAASVLETAEADIEYKAGRFGIVGTDRSITLFDLARRAAEMKTRGDIPESLDTKVNAETPLTFPNGCHIAEVEIDPDTGALALVAYAAVDDCGNALNQMIVEGQTHGSIAQGLGQALMENLIFDPSGGQLTTGSFMDYAMPRADDMPAFKDALHLVPAKTNPLGVKGAGEAGTTAAISAVMNAIADAIPGGAGAHLDMPATPEKLWHACQRARQA
jgi:carbon-monoxide dehydrogenase large subunit